MPKISKLTKKLTIQSILIFLRCVIGVSLIFWLTSCKVGPNFKSPPPPLTPSYTSTPLPLKTVKSSGKSGHSQYLIPGADIPHEWWLLFKSPQLNDLILAGMAKSPNIEAAKAALKEAEENWRAEVGSLFPTITTAFSGERQRFSSSIFGTNNDVGNTFNLYNANVGASYTLDAFGGIRRQIEALGAQVDYQQYQVQAAYLTLTANIVTSAINEASLREQIKTTNQLLKVENNLLRIIKLQYQLGSISLADVLTQQTLVSQTQASLPPLEKNLALLQNSLAVLVGTLPAENDLPVFNLDDLNLPSHIPISIPSTLVCQRPDVRAAEALLHEATAQIGVATANLYPQFNLAANYGFQANKLNELFSPDSVVWSILGQATQTIFSGGTLIAQRRAAIAASREALAQYRQTLLKAYEDVADALNALVIDAETLKADTEARVAAQKNMEIAKKQYALGAVSFLTLLNAQSQYQNTVLVEVQARAARYSDTAALFQALGGGWWHPAPIPMMVLPPPQPVLMVSTQQEPVISHRTSK